MLCCRRVVLSSYGATVLSHHGVAMTSYHKVAMSSHREDIVLSCGAAAESNYQITIRDSRCNTN